eukprot:scaffold3559_cov284-Chaetoceros_neogracile.AAC.45
MEYLLTINILLAWELIICWIVSDTNWSRGGTGHIGVAGTDSSKAAAHGIIPDQFFAITTSRGHINYRILSNNATPIEIVEQAKDDKYSSSSHEVGYIIFEPTLFQDCVSSFPSP